MNDVFSSFNLSTWLPLLHVIIYYALVTQCVSRMCAGYPLTISKNNMTGHIMVLLCVSSGCSHDKKLMGKIYHTYQ